jgi:calcium-dependent protein kinase
VTSADTETSSGNAGKGSAPLKAIKAGGFATSQLIADNPGKIQDFYDMEKKKIGEGSYGSVSRATKKGQSGGKKYAVKSIAKAQMKNMDRLKAEVAIMKIMDHPNIIKLFEGFEDHRNVYLVMELCSGGELFDRIIEAGHFSEVKAAILMQQIFRAMFYMHESKICHRDLKPENFIFQTKDPIEKSPLKIIDFGLSCKFTEGQVLSTKAGTPYYVAPQVLSGKYDHMSDLWSCGVIMYVLLCGYPPFYGETDADVLAKVRLGNFSFSASDWKNVSEDAKVLIRMLLKMNPRDRYTAQQALNHEWVKNKAPKAKNINLSAGMFDNLKKFRSQNKLKKVAIHLIAGQLEDGQIKRLRETFMALDGNGDGLLTVNEMKEGLTSAGFKEIPPDLVQIMEDIDSDGSGVIDYTEFLAATLDKKQYLQESAVWEAFRFFDKNGDGKIDKKELEAVLGDQNVKDAVGEDTLAKLLQDVDADGDGEIDFQEFMTMMHQD